MTTPMLPAVRDVAETENASRAILHWRGRDCSVTPVGGQVAAFSRGSSATLTDAASATFTLGYVQPNFESKVWADSTRRMGLTMGATDRWSVAANWRPRAFGFYHEFIQSGSMASAGVALWSLCNAGGTGARVVLDSTGTYYRLRHHNGTTEVTVTLTAAPTTGQRVVMWGFVYADGSVQLYQSINEGAATNTSASSANALAASWAASSSARLSSLGTTNGAPAWHRVFKLVAGTPSVTQLQRYF